MIKISLRIIGIQYRDKRDKVLEELKKIGEYYLKRNLSL